MRVERTTEKRTLACGCKQQRRFDGGGNLYWHRTRKCGKPEGLFGGDVCQHWRKRLDALQRP